MKYKYDVNAFLEKNELCYYFLGFIFADGCLTNGYITININNKDVEILEKFKVFLKTQKPIYSIKETNSVMFSFKNKNIYESLLLYNLTPKKSLTTKFPKNIPENMIHHFIRGYFDGDGSVSVINRKTTKGLKINIVGTFEFLNDLQHHLIKNIKTSPKSISQITKNKNTYQLNFKSIVDVLKFRDFIYKDATIFLNRKNQIFNTEVNLKKENATSSRYRNICLRKRTNKWSVLYYINNIRKEKSGFLNEKEALIFLKKITGT